MDKSPPSDKRSKSKRWTRKESTLSRSDGSKGKSDKKDKKEKKNYDKSAHKQQPQQIVSNEISPQRNSKRKQPNYKGYDDYPINLESGEYAGVWWEPVDVDGATTRGVPLSEASSNLSSLAVHDLFWEDNEFAPSPPDGKPKGFLHFTEINLPDGKPKGFLSFIDASIPEKPKEQTSIFRNTSKSKGFFQFLEIFGKHKRSSSQSTSSPSLLPSSDHIFDFRVPSSAYFNNNFSPVTSPRKNIFPADPKLHRLGAVLPNPSIPPLNPGLAASHLHLPESYKRKKITIPFRDEKDDFSDIEYKNESSEDTSEAYPSLNLTTVPEINTTKFIPESQGRDWNAEYQYLMECLFDDDNAIDKMRSLCEAFAKVAKEIGTIIISELFLPPEYRTIPPITSTVGGVAGGEKYVYSPEGIFFKFAVDERGIYGGDEFIMKAAGQELKSLLELMDCRVQGIHFPLMVLVDYRGYRLIAMPLLPVGPDTLVYGSADGGSTIYSISSEMNVRMQLIGSILNLAGHDVWNLDHTEKTTLYAPVDIEGHLGRDDRFYILDTARLFPPSIPVAGLKGCHLYRLLRPELVKNNPVPLCSDAYSTWEIENIVSYNEDIAEATHRLENEVIPDFGENLQLWFSNNNNNNNIDNNIDNDESYSSSGDFDEDNNIDIDIYSICEYKKLKISLHRRGINLRCTGLVRKYVESKKIKKFLLIEIISRVAKKILFGRMRGLQSSDEYDYNSLIANYFNLLFCNTYESKKYWSITIKNSLLKRFCNALSIEERDPNYDLRYSLSMYAMYLRLNDLCGLKFSEDVSEIIKQNYYIENDDYFDDDIFDNEYAIFFPNDIIEMYASERSIHHIDFAEGTILSRQAAHAGDDAEELFALADERFQSAIDRKPDDFRALHNWALSLLYRANMKTGEEASELYTRACKQVESSLILNPEDGSAYLLWGNILSEKALRCIDISISYNIFEDAVEKYSLSQKYFNNRSTTNEFELLYNWGCALLHLSKRTSDSNICEKHLEDASSKYEDAINIEKSCNAYRNWGIVLAKLARLNHDNDEEKSLNYFNAAEEKFKLSLEGTSSDSEVYFNWGNAFFHGARASAGREQYRMAFQQLASAGDKYLSAIECGTSYNYDALINWGKVLNLQIHLNPNDHPDNYSLLYYVDLYLAIFSNFINREENNGDLSLKPILGLAKANDNEISSKAVEILRNLASSHITSVKEEASRALRIAIRSQPSSSSLSSSVPSLQQQIILNNNNNLLLKNNNQQSISTSTIGDDSSNDDNNNNSSIINHQQTLTSKNPSPWDKSISIFLQKLDTTRTTSMLKKNSLDEVPLLSDFQRLSDVSDLWTSNACTVTRKGTSELYILKIRYDNSNTNTTFNMQQSSVNADDMYNRMIRIIQGRLPFLAKILYSYKKENNYYLIQEYISEEYNLSRQRQTGKFSKDLTLHRSSSFNFKKSLDDSEDSSEKKINLSSGSNHGSRPNTPRLNTKLFAMHHEQLFPRCVLDEKTARFYISEIIILFGNLHSLGFIYGNLTPSTIHLDKSGHICLTRFSFLLEGCTLPDDICTTAPEVLSGELYCKEADWWAVGTVLYEFLTSTMIPKEGEEYPDYLSKAAKSILTKLLHVDPKKRLGSKGIEEIKNHKFFSGFDWVKAENRDMTPPITFNLTKSTSSNSVCDIDDNFRAPTIVANIQQSDFHQHSMVKPSSLELQPPTPLHKPLTANN